MQALTHLFGSTDGYRTLARAPGVSDAEDAALAALGLADAAPEGDTGGRPLGAVLDTPNGPVTLR